MVNKYIIHVIIDAILFVLCKIKKKNMDYFSYYYPR